MCNNGLKLRTWIFMYRWQSWLLDNSRIRQLADCQLSYWTSRGLDNSRMPPATACLVFVLLAASARARVVQSASWRIRELSSYCHHVVLPCHIWCIHVMWHVVRSDSQWDQDSMLSYVAAVYWSSRRCCLVWFTRWRHQLAPVWLCLLQFACGVAEAKCIVATAVCVCLSVPRRIPTLLHGPGCNLGEW